MSRKPFTWDSHEGREVLKRLDAWGARAREVQATGDSSAIPSAEGSGGRGKPGDLPAVFLAAVDVDMALAEYRGGEWLMKLLHHVFRDGRQPATTHLEWSMPDGSTVKLLPEEAAPEKATGCVAHSKAPEGFDTSEFADETLDWALSRYFGQARTKKQRMRFLQAAIWSFGAFMAFKLFGGKGK